MEGGKDGQMGDTWNSVNSKKENEEGKKLNEREKTERQTKRGRERERAREAQPPRPRAPRAWGRLGGRRAGVLGCPQRRVRVSLTASAGANEKNAVWEPAGLCSGRCAPPPPRLLGRPGGQGIIGRWLEVSGLMMSVKSSGDLPAGTCSVALITRQRWEWSSGRGSLFLDASNLRVCLGVLGGRGVLSSLVAGEARLSPGEKLYASRRLGDEDSCRHEGWRPRGAAVCWVHGLCSLSHTTKPTNASNVTQVQRLWSQTVWV